MRNGDERGSAALEFALVLPLLLVLTLAMVQVGLIVRDSVVRGGTYSKFKVEWGRKYFVNPGSVGVAYDRHLPEDSLHLDPWVEYAVLSSEGERLGLEFRRVPYDVDELVLIILSSGRPYAEDFAGQYTQD